MKWKAVFLMGVLLVSPVVMADILYTVYIDSNTGYLFRADDNMNTIWQSTNQRSIHRFTVSPLNGNIYAGFDNLDRMVKQFDRNTGELIGITVPTISGLASNHCQNLKFGYDWNGDGVPDLWVITRDSLLVFNGAGTVGAGATTELARWTVPDTSGNNGTGGGAMLFGPDITNDGIPELYVGKGSNDSNGRINVYDLASSAVGNENLVKVATYSASSTRDIEEIIMGPDVNGDGRLDLLVVSARNYQLRAYDYAVGTDLGVIEEGITGRYYPLGVAAMPNGSLLVGSRMKSELDPLWVSGVETVGGNMLRYDPASQTTVVYAPTLLAYWPATTDYRYTYVQYLQPTEVYDPTPEDGQKVTLDLAEVSWTNPEPNIPGGIVTCDVWFSENYPEYLPFSDPNVSDLDPNIIPWYSQYVRENPNFESYATKVVSNQAVSAMELADATTLPLTFGKRYFWRVDTRDTSNPEAGTTKGKVWTFLADNSAPQVDAGAIIYAYLTDGTVTVTMAPSVSDDGRPDPPGKYTVLWEVTVEDPDVVINSPTIETTTVTITRTGSFVLRLTVNDGQLSNSDLVTINVYADACQAAHAVPGYSRPAGDINDDCEVDLIDLAQLAADWLESTALVSPLP